MTHRLETRHVSRVHVIEQDDRASARVGDVRDEPGDALQRQQVQLRPVELNRVIRQRPLGYDEPEPTVERPQGAR
jgi:hypothetical protein